MLLSTVGVCGTSRHSGDERTLRQSCFHVGAMADTAIGWEKGLQTLICISPLPVPGKSATEN